MTSHPSGCIEVGFECNLVFLKLGRLEVAIEFYCPCFFLSAHLAIVSLLLHRLGPALLAFTLMMCAYSLRTWRRNGVACDELLFLPGTLLGHEHGIEGPLIEMAEQIPLDEQEQQQLIDQSNGLSNKATSSPTRQSRGGAEADLAAGGLALTGSVRHRRAYSDDEASTLERETSQDDIRRNAGGDDEQESWDMNNDDDDQSQVQGLLHRSTNTGAGGTDDTEGDGQYTGLFSQRWWDNNPIIKQLWAIFFGRSDPNSPQNAEYAPSGPSVLGAGMDLCVPALFNFHLFIEAYNHMEGHDGSDLTAKILPIIFLSVLIVRTVIPPSRRFRFWGTLKFTLIAPLHHVRFRDEFIGDVLTSYVRPGQDLFFALSYYLTVIWGTISGKYGLTDSGLLLEESWLLHNVIMPSFAILPLWLKYLQTLRQAYDSNKRWPYQANSFKYLSATLVVIYAVTHPEDRSSPWWMACFGFCLLYQICWDVIVDWELFEIQQTIQFMDSESDSWSARISSFQPNSHFLLTIQLYVVQPILGHYQRLRAAIPSWRQIQLRQKRLYKTEAFYWKIFVFNALTRFTWMWCFIPAYHFSKSRTVLYSTSDVNSYWGVLLPIGEIVRRTVWGFLFVERETIKLMEEDAKYSRKAGDDDDEDDDDEDADSKFGDRTFRNQLLPTWLDNQQQVAHNAATSRSKQRDRFMRQLFVFELYGWAAAFVALGCWAAN